MSEVTLCMDRSVKLTASVFKGRFQTEIPFDRSNVYVAIRRKEFENAYAWLEKARFRANKAGVRNLKSETRNPKLETRNPKPENRNLKSQTLNPNPKPQTSNLKPQTPKPKPETRDPKPETRDPKPEIRNPKSGRNPFSKKDCLRYSTAGGGVRGAGGADALQSC